MLQHYHSKNGITIIISIISLSLFDDSLHHIDCSATSTNMITKFLYLICLFLQFFPPILLFYFLSPFLILFNDASSRTYVIRGCTQKFPDWPP
jgi:hypothetical protein